MGGGGSVDGSSQPWSHSVLLFQSPLSTHSEPPPSSNSCLRYRTFFTLHELHIRLFLPLSSFTEPLSPSSSPPLSLNPHQRSTDPEQGGTPSTGNHSGQPLGDGDSWQQLHKVWPSPWRVGLESRRAYKKFPEFSGLKTGVGGLGARQNRALSQLCHSTVEWLEASPCTSLSVSCLLCKKGLVVLTHRAAVQVQCGKEPKPEARNSEKGVAESGLRTGQGK